MWQPRLLTNCANLWLSNWKEKLSDLSTVSTYLWRLGIISPQFHFIQYLINTIVLTNQNCYWWKCLGPCIDNYKVNYQCTITTPLKLKCQYKMHLPHFFDCISPWNRKRPWFEAAHAGFEVNASRPRRKTAKINRTLNCSNVVETQNSWL